MYKYTRYYIYTTHTYTNKYSKYTVQINIYRVLNTPLNTMTLFAEYGYFCLTHFSPVSHFYTENLLFSDVFKVYRNVSLD